MNIRQLIDDKYMIENEDKRQLIVPTPLMVLTPSPAFEVQYKNTDTDEYETIDDIHVAVDESFTVFTELGVYAFDHIGMDMSIHPRTLPQKRTLDGTKQLAQKIVQMRDESFGIQQRVNCSPEPLRSMVYAALGDEIASTIDGTDLYHEIVDHLELIY